MECESYLRISESRGGAALARSSGRATLSALCPFTSCSVLLTSHLVSRLVSSVGRELPHPCSTQRDHIFPEFVVKTEGSFPRSLSLQTSPAWLSLWDGWKGGCIIGLGLEESR